MAAGKGGAGAKLPTMNTPSTPQRRSRLNSRPYAVRVWQPVKVSRLVSLSGGGALGYEAPGAPLERVGIAGATLELQACPALARRYARAVGNALPAAARFFAAAHGKVRPSVRWRTREVHRSRRVYLAGLFVRREARRLERGGGLIVGGMVPRYAYPRRTWQRQARKEIQGEQRFYRLIDLAGVGNNELEERGLDDCLKHLEHARGQLKAGTLEEWPPSLGAFLATLGDREGLRAAEQCIKERRNPPQAAAWFYAAAHGQRWKSARRAVSTWAARGNGWASRLERLPGLWQPVTAAHLSAFPSAAPPTQNRYSLAALAPAGIPQAARSVAQRLRPSSPRWRGTASHARERRALLPRGPAHSTAGFLAALGRSTLPGIRFLRDRLAPQLATPKPDPDLMRVARVRAAGGARAWLGATAFGLFGKELHLAEARRNLLKHLRALALHARDLFQELTEELRALRGSSAPAALLGDLARQAWPLLREAAARVLAALTREPDPPARPLYAQPCPPSAPLAPPLS